MSTHEHTPEELEHALRVIRSECLAHPEDCTECPLSFSDGSPIQQCGITDKCGITGNCFTPAEWDISPTQRWQAFADETRRADP